MGNSIGTILGQLEGPILVTGHTGFKGTWLTRYLSALNLPVAGYSINSTSESLYQLANLNGEISEKMGDIRNLSEITEWVNKIQPSVIFHLAAQALVLDSFEDPVGTFQTNLIGTVNILEAARNCKSVKAVGVVTTDKVYENLGRPVRFKETDPLLGSDPYSASKVAAENACESWKLFAELENGPSISILRSGNVIGGGDYSRNRIMADIVRAKLESKPLEVRNPESTRPWQHVLDPLTGYISAVEHSLNCPIKHTFNFGPSEPALKVREILDIVNEIWPDLEIEDSNTNFSKRESRALELDSTYAEKHIGWRPKFTQKEAVTETLKWWEEKESGKLPVKEIVDLQIQRYMRISTL